MSKASRRRNAIQDERDAEANFLYAANLGNAVRLGGPSSAALRCPLDQSIVHRRSTSNSHGPPQVSFVSATQNLHSHNIRVILSCLLLRIMLPVVCLPLPFEEMKDHDESSLLRLDTVVRISPFWEC